MTDSMFADTNVMLIADGVASLCGSAPAAGGVAFSSTADTLDSNVAKYTLLTTSISSAVVLKVCWCAGGCTSNHKFMYEVGKVALSGNSCMKARVTHKFHNIRAIDTGLFVKFIDWRWRLYCFNYPAFGRMNAVLCFKA